MAEWIDDCGDVTLKMTGLEVGVYRVIKPGFKWYLHFDQGTHGVTDTLHESQRAALDALITQLDAWKEQAAKAREELEQQVEVK